MIWHQAVIRPLSVPIYMTTDRSRFRRPGLKSRTREAFSIYDIIGDIHGQALELETLLEQLGYRQSEDCYRHERRKVIFLGDFIDRGKYQKRVLNLVRPMIEYGAAMSVMGNHEYNAIAYYYPDVSGGHLRERSEKNKYQHKAFLKEYGQDLEAWGEVIDWFKTLPLWLDLDRIRVVHACWDQADIEKLSQLYGPDGKLTDELLIASANRSGWQYQAIETLLKGKEIKLPDNKFFYDKDGHRRHEIRVRWWAGDQNYRDAYLGPESARTHIPDDSIEGDHLVEYKLEEKPVFIGHYWMEGPPTPLAQNIACLDYSVANLGGKLVAYRWDGEQTIDPSKYVICNRMD
jgi:hypothetical protein